MAGGESEYGDKADRPTTHKETAAVIGLDEGDED
jgi:hypothetical protein